MCNILQVAKKDYHISLYKKYGIGIDFDLWQNRPLRLFLKNNQSICAHNARFSNNSQLTLSFSTLHTQVQCILTNELQRDVINR